MCGIVGGVFNKGFDVSVIEQSLDAIRHRGPDDSGVYQDGNVFLGNRRLAIIDLQGGHQPVFNEDESVVVVFNGEIYNYLELIDLLESKGHVFRTKSDTECLAHLWEDYGTEMCRMLRGMFAFAIWDSSSKSMFVARDRFGKKPLYYFEPAPGEVLFASELKALRILTEHAGRHMEINEQGIYDYLSFGVIPQPETIITDLFALPAASWMLVNREGKKSEVYWKLNYERWESISYEATLEKIRQLVSEAVRLRLRSDVPLGVFLSGGIDSSVVTYEAQRQFSGELQSFTVSMNDRELDESRRAGLAARYFGVINTVIPFKFNPEDDLMMLVDHFDQPYFDSSAMPTMKVAKHARKYVKVVLTGDGGDEIFAGYRRHLAAAWLDWFKFLSCANTRLTRNWFTGFGKARRTPTGFAIRFLRLFFANGGERYLTMTTDMLNDTDKKQYWELEPKRSTEGFIESIDGGYADEFTRQMNWDLHLNLLNDLLVKMDMSTMAYSLEARSPLLDHKLAEFVSTVPLKFISNKFRTKSLLRDAYSKLLPKEIIDGPKKGFEVPLGSFLKNELRPILMDTLARPDSRVGAYLSRKFLDGLINGNVMADRNKPYILYALLVLELWLRRFKLK